MPPDDSAARTSREDLPAVIWELLKEACEGCDPAGASPWEEVSPKSIRDIALPLHVALVLVVAAAPPGGDREPDAAHFPDSPGNLKEILQEILATRPGCEDVAALRDRLSKLVKAVGVKAAVHRRDRTATGEFCKPRGLAGGRVRAAYAPQEQVPLLRQQFSRGRRAFREPIAPLDRFRGYTLVLQGSVELEHVPVAPGGTGDSPLSSGSPPLPRVWLVPVGGHNPALEGWVGPDAQTLYFRLKPEAPYGDALGESLKTLAQVRSKAAETRDLLVLPELSLTEPELGLLNKTLLGLRAPYLGLVVGMTHTTRRAGSPWVRSTARVEDGTGYLVWEHVKRGPYRAKYGVLHAMNWLQPTPNPQDDEDVWEGLVPGHTLQWANTRWGRLGVLICSDLLEERWPSMRDLVRLARLDLLILVCWTDKTAPFEALLEPLARMGVGVLAVNHAHATHAVHRSGAPSTDRPEPWSALAWFPSWGTEVSGRPNAFCWTREYPKDLWSRVPGKAWTKIDSDEARLWGVQVVEDAPALVVDMNRWLMATPPGVKAAGAPGGPAQDKPSQGEGGTAPEGSAGGYTEGVTPEPISAPSTEDSLPDEILRLLDVPTQEAPIPAAYTEEQILHWIESGLVEVMEPLAYGAPPVWGLTVRGEQVANKQRAAHGEQQALPPEAQVAVATSEQGVPLSNAQSRASVNPPKPDVLHVEGHHSQGRRIGARNNYDSIWPKRSGTRQDSLVQRQGAEALVESGSRRSVGA